jgi:hypothetical protein
VNKYPAIFKDGKYIRPKFYFKWSGMNQRCHGSENRWSEHYKHRGIYVCEEWRNSYDTFHEWCLATYKEGMTLDRRDNDGPYSPDNCRWVTMADQNRNKRVTDRVKENFRRAGKIRLEKRRLIFGDARARTAAVCTYCRSIKPHADFYPNRTAASGYGTACRDCSLKKAKDYYARNREKYLKCP